MPAASGFLVPRSSLCGRASACRDLGLLDHDSDRGRIHADLLLVSPRVLVLHGTRDQREKGMIAPDTDVVPRHDAGAALPDEDLATLDDLPVIPLDTEHLRFAVP